MRLIDADKFEAFIIRTNGDEEFVNGVQYVLERIDSAPTVNAIPIPDNATNGDVIKAMFPNSIVKEPTSIFDKKVIVFIALDYPVKFHIDWWDAPYKESK